MCQAHYIRWPVTSPAHSKGGLIGKGLQPAPPPTGANQALCNLLQRPHSLARPSKLSSEGGESSKKPTSLAQRAILIHVRQCRRMSHTEQHSLSSLNPKSRYPAYRDFVQRFSQPKLTLFGRENSQKVSNNYIATPGSIYKNDVRAQPAVGATFPRVLGPLQLSLLSHCLPSLRGFEQVHVSKDLHGIYCTRSTGDFKSTGECVQV